MAKLENPMGTNGFEFVEYAHHDPKQLFDLFEKLGFQAIAKHRHKDVTLFRQGNITFLVNGEPNSFASNFTKIHGPCACGMAFRVKDANFVFEQSLAHGAKAYEGDTSHIGSNVPAIYGIGNSLLYLIDQYENDAVYEAFEFTTDDRYPVGLGLKELDHLTHNVYQGNMDKWAEYYENLFNFKEIRHFDIQGKHTGLWSRAMSSPCGKIRIPLNESKDEQSQIAEYLHEYNGEGIQHVALSTQDIYASIEAMRNIGMEFMDTPDTYFEMIDKRLPGHGEDISRMHKNKILIDGGTLQGGGLLLQIFTQTVIGPIFFEIIQRKGNEGFGEGNFQALFDSIELDQIRRGVLNAEE